MVQKGWTTHNGTKRQGILIGLVPSTGFGPIYRGLAPGVGRGEGDGVNIRENRRRAWRMWGERPGAGTWRMWGESPGAGTWRMWGERPGAGTWRMWGGCAEGSISCFSPVYRRRAWRMWGECAEGSISCFSPVYRRRAWRMWGECAEGSISCFRRWQTTLYVA
jgi:hypothetical protein